MADKEKERNEKRPLGSGPLKARSESGAAHPTAEGASGERRRVVKDERERSRRER